MTHDNNVLVKAICNLFKKWDISNKQAEILLNLSDGEYHEWKIDQSIWINDDTKRRILNFLDIHAYLGIIFLEHSRSYRWIKAYNKTFGKSALDVMLTGEIKDNDRIREYLSAIVNVP